MKERWKEWLRIPVLFPDMPPVKLVFRSARAVVIASCLSFQMYLMRVKERASKGKFWEKDLRITKKSMSKAFWSHFKHFGRLLRKKLVCSGSVSHSQQTWWKSSQPARCKTRHTGKFSSQQTYVQTLLAGWVWSNSNVQPFSEGEGLGRKEKKVSDKYHIPAILNIQSP